MASAGQGHVGNKVRNTQGRAGEEASTTALGAMKSLTGAYRVETITWRAREAIAAAAIAGIENTGQFQRLSATRAYHLETEEDGAAGVLRLVNQPPRHGGDSGLEPRRALTAAIDLPRRGQPL